MKNNQPHLTTHMVDENDPRRVINEILGIPAFPVEAQDTQVRVPEQLSILEPTHN